MELLIGAGIVFVVMLGLGLIGYFVFGPAERTAGEQHAADLQAAKRDGLQVGAAVVEKQLADAEMALRARAEAEKQRDAVTVANELLKEKP